MPQSQEDSNIHTVRIQQSYWMKECSEEKLEKLGAVCMTKLMNQVDYYDTDTYDLAMNKAWLSKTEGKWRLIVDQTGNETSDRPEVGKDENRPDNDRVKPRRWDRSITKTSENKSTKVGKSPTKPNQKTSKREPESMAASADPLDISVNDTACYELLEEREIVDYLSPILNKPRERLNPTLDNFVQCHGIQNYSSLKTMKQAIYRLRDICTIAITADEAGARKSAVVYLEVGIDSVTQGFQRLEQLASDLDLQVQTEP